MHKLARAIVGLLAALGTTANAAKLQNRVSVRWGPYQDAARATHYVLSCCSPTGCETLQIDGGSAIAATMTLKATVPGDASCSLVACDAAGCSAPSNTVKMDRTAPARPGSIQYRGN